MTFNKAACGVCHKDFDGIEAIVRVKKCGHLFHGKCFASGVHITKIGNVVEKIICPEAACKKVIVAKKKAKPAEDIAQHIEVIAFPKPQQAPQHTSQQVPGQQHTAAKESRGVKYIAYMSIAFICMTVAMVVYPSLIALGIGIAFAGPIGYFVGKSIEKYQHA